MSAGVHPDAARFDDVKEALGTVTLTRDQADLAHVIVAWVFGTGPTPVARPTEAAVLDLVRALR